MILVDTGSWLYVLDPRSSGKTADQMQALAYFEKLNERIGTTDLIIAETHKWLLHT